MTAATRWFGFTFYTLLAVSLSACSGETRTTPQGVSSTQNTNTCVDSTGCDSGETCDAGECVANAGNGACQTTMDCPEDQYCQAKQCVAGDSDDGGGDDDECKKSSDCADGEKCVNYACAECANNDDCDAGNVCAGGKCVDENDTDCDDNSDCSAATVCDTTDTHKCVQCISDSQCARNSRLRAANAKVCRDHQCTDPTGECESNDECNGYACQSDGSCAACTATSQCDSGSTCNTSTGKCVPNGTTPSCSVPSDCNGEACVDGQCQHCINNTQCTTGSGAGQCDVTTGQCTSTECTTANDCNAGEACYAPGVCGSCIADGECRTGEYCYIAPNDQTGSCYPSESSSCTNNTQCPSDLVCYSGVCATCLADDECDSDEYCSWTGHCAGGSTSTTTCTLNTQCAQGQSCVGGSCTSNPGTGSGGSGQFGSTCTNTQQCVYGLTCAGITASNSICTAPCVGSGEGGNDDCPSGYACVDWETTTLDGLKICYSAKQLGSSTLGYPFTSAPGASCDGDNPYANSCQTSVCTSRDECARTCNSNNDCSWGEVCYAYPDENIGYIHQCWPSDTNAYLPAGYQCNENDECDSGVCLGQCSDGNACGSSADCSDGYCSGTCVDHCRSVADCDSATACNFWPMYLQNSYSGWTPVCSGRIYAGTSLVGDSCNSDADCDSEWCIDGLCTTPCATSDDCNGNLSGYACTPINFYNGSTPVYSGSFCL